MFSTCNLWILSKKILILFFFGFSVNSLMGQLLYIWNIGIQVNQYLSVYGEVD